MKGYEYQRDRGLPESSKVVSSNHRISAPRGHLDWDSFDVAIQNVGSLVCDIVKVDAR